MQYTIKQLKFDDDGKSLQKVVDLQNIVYDSKKKKRFTKDLLKFWYLDNPNGRVISFNAFYGRDIVAHYACIPVKMLIQNKISIGLLDIATVTHPEHRGKGLFKLLAKTTYDYAKINGFDFVIGVANANSFPGYMKYFPFTFVGQLDVKFGLFCNNLTIPQKNYSFIWNKDEINWRLNKHTYSILNNLVLGTYKNIPFVKLFMGLVPDQLLGSIKIREKKFLFIPLVLYIGLGLDLSNKFFFKVPKFIKRSPFNLIFMDLTDGQLPQINKQNIFFQLIDFDVA